MMNSYELTAKQKEIMQSIAKGITVKPGSSCDSIRSIVRFGFIAYEQKKQETQRKVAENNDTLSKRLADEKNAVLQRELKQHASDMKAALHRKTAELFEAKRKAVTEYVKQMPSDNLNRKLQYIQNYGSLFDRELWEVFITDPEIVSNYLACKIVEKVASDNHIDFYSTPQLHKINENIDDYEEMVKSSIDRIDVEHDIILGSLISENPESPVQKLINEIDTDIATIIPAPQKTILKRLKDAEQHAYNESDFRTSARIKIFLEDHGKVLATPEEIKESLLNEAEQLVTQGMSAKKGD